MALKLTPKDELRLAVAGISFWPYTEPRTMVQHHPTVCKDIDRARSRLKETTLVAEIVRGLSDPMPYTVGRRARRIGGRTFLGHSKVEKKAYIPHGYFFALVYLMSRGVDFSGHEKAISDFIEEHLVDVSSVAQCVVCSSLPKLVKGPSLQEKQRKYQERWQDDEVGDLWRDSWTAAVLDPTFFGKFIRRELERPVVSSVLWGIQYYAQYLGAEHIMALGLDAKSWIELFEKTDRVSVAGEGWTENDKEKWFRLLVVGAPEISTLELAGLLSRVGAEGRRALMGLLAQAKDQRSQMR